VCALRAFLRETACRDAPLDDGGRAQGVETPYEVGGVAARQGCAIAHHRHLPSGGADERHGEHHADP
ncbi:hypothetical protein, partial [uncultured Brevundimonas sp.]|uniref:hypothetical protein n=1 Tax=uncultured Brevundimonas sp. TaxID=213418 RepID=UPI0025F60B44